MDSNNPLPKHVQIDNTKKPEKKYVIFHNLKAIEGQEFYVSANGINEAFLKTVELKSQGATRVVVYQEIELKVTIR